MLQGKSIRKENRSSAALPRAAKVSFSQRPTVHVWAVGTTALTPPAYPGSSSGQHWVSASWGGCVRIPPPPATRDLLISLVLATLLGHQQARPKGQSRASSPRDLAPVRQHGQAPEQPCCVPNLCRRGTRVTADLTSHGEVRTGLTNSHSGSKAVSAS